MPNPESKSRSGKRNLAVMGFLFGGGAAMAIANSGVANASTSPEPHLPNPIVHFVEQHYQAPKPGTYYSDGAVQAWCANFVSFALREAGSPIGGINGWRTPAVVGLQKTFAEKGILENRNYVPRPGDTVLYGGEHTNIVVDVQGDTIITVGGNESQSVSKSSISRHAGKITGYGRTSELVTSHSPGPVEDIGAAPDPHPVWGPPPPPAVQFVAHAAPDPEFTPEFVPEHFAPEPLPEFIPEHFAPAPEFTPEPLPEFIPEPEHFAPEPAPVVEHFAPEPLPAPEFIPDVIDAEPEFAPAPEHDEAFMHVSFDPAPWEHEEPMPAPEHVEPFMPEHTAAEHLPLPEPEGMMVHEGL